MMFRTFGNLTVNLQLITHVRWNSHTDAGRAYGSEIYFLDGEKLFLRHDVKGFKELKEYIINLHMPLEEK